MFYYVISILKNIQQLNSNNTDINNPVISYRHYAKIRF